MKNGNIFNVRGIFLFIYLGVIVSSFLNGALLWNLSEVGEVFSSCSSSCFETKESNPCSFVWKVESGAKKVIFFIRGHPGAQGIPSSREMEIYLKMEELV